MNRILACPNCGFGQTLTKVRLAPSLSALRCQACEGTLLDVTDYRFWCEREPVAPDQTAPPLSGEDTPARSCPSCNRLMHRYRVGIQPDFRIDHCAACQEIWLDRGEWDALVRSGLALRLTDIVTEAWQRRMQDAASHVRREAGLRQKHGDACVDELLRIREWLAAQPAREELIALLRAGW